MVYLVKVTEQYRCDSAEEAKQLIEEAKKNSQYSVVKTSDEIRSVKLKGEIVDEWHRVLITKSFNEEKEPESYIMPMYTEDRDDTTD